MKIDPILDIRGVAKYLKLDPQTVSRKAQKGELPGFKIGNRWRFRREEIEQWITSCRSTGHSGDLQKYFQRQPDLRLVYLFGSRARGNATSTSDTDMAVLFQEGIERSRQDQILSEIGRRVENKTDLVPLNNATPLLKYEVVSDGKILYQSITNEEVVRFELGVYREYFHTGRIRRMQFEALEA